jgi:hypothetical protein
VSPQVAEEIAQDAFLNGVFYDGVDLRNFARWTRNIPIEVAVALELGSPPSFDGVYCVDCGNRFRTEFDHVQPHGAKARLRTATSNRGAGAATRRRRNATARPASSSPQSPDTSRSSALP